MSKVILDMTMSLDGFTAGPNISIETTLGHNGERLHTWLFGGKTPLDADVIDEQLKTTGAFVTGRRTFDVGEAPWGDDGAFGMPCFVLTHQCDGSGQYCPTVSESGPYRQNIRTYCTTSVRRRDSPV